jgi:polar amino acid transport system substrate-binding protein
MKKLATLFMFMVLTAVSTAALAAPPADTLAEIKKKKVLVAGVKDSLPPFGYIDEKTRAIIGYDIDFVNAIAAKLGAKVELKPVACRSCRKATSTSLPPP